MWTHLLEILLTGAGIFLGPLMVVAAMGGALVLLDLFFTILVNRSSLTCAHGPFEDFRGLPGSNHGH